MIEAILMVVILIALIVGSYTDLKTREVPDWVNYGIMFIGLGIRLIYSVYEMDYMIFVNGIFGFLIGMAVGFFMYYTGQWGGGDTKMLMGLGGLLGFNLDIGIFLLNVMIVGAMYGLTWTVVLAIKNWKAFWRKFKIMIRLRKIMIMRKIFLAIALMLLAAFFFLDQIFFRIVALLLALMMYLSFYMWIMVKVVEEVAMLTLVEPSKLTEGDWIMHDIKYKGKVIASPKDLGVKNEQIKKLIKLFVLSLYLVK